jgi:hypothetical protein
MTSRFGLLCFLIGSACLSAAANAQTADVGSVHWAYSSYFGTGWYEVRDNRDVFVLRVAPQWQLRETELAEDGERTIGIDFKLAITTGLDNFSVVDIPDAVTPDNLASLSVTPGVDFTIPINERWTLRPFAAIGWGALLNESASAWSYWGGIKSHYRFSHGKLDWALVNSIGYVGYAPSDGDSEDFWPIMTGLEFDYPMGKLRLAGEQLFFSWHGMYTSFEDDLDLEAETGLADPISDQWEFGLSVHKESSPIKFGWFSFDRLGLAYRFSSSGDLKGISLVLQSVFDR